MASSDHIVTLTVGTQRVSAAVFSQNKKGGLVLNKFASRSVLAEPSAENMRVAQIGNAIAELVSSLKLKQSPVAYSLAGQSVFVRFIKLPPIDSGNIEQLVQFEAQQQIPFPLEEVVWSYHMLSDSGLEKEAILIAIKNDLLNEIDSLVVSGGLKTKGVDCAPTALYNAFRSSYPDLAEPVLLLDIGSKTSNLLYIEPGRFFTRSVTMGGSSITAAIAREYNISFQEAENLKLSKGLVALTGGHTSSMDEETARLASCIRNALTRLVAEIPRTTNHYRSQFNGEAPKHVFLCGGGSALPYTREFIQERLQIPVQFFNPLHNVTLGKGVDAEAASREAGLLGEAVGLALKQLQKAEIDIDLVPLTVAKARESRKKLPFVIVGMLALVAAGGIYAWGAMNGLEKAQIALDQESSTLSNIERIQTTLDKTAKQEKAIDAKLAEYAKLTQAHYAFADILSEIVNKAPSDSYWIVEFDPLIGFDKNNPESITTGSSVVNKTFKADKTLSVHIPDPNAGDTKKVKGAKPPVPTINALRLRGLVRMDKGGFESAEWIRKQLEKTPENSLFDFTVNGKPMEARQIIRFEDKPTDKDAFAKPFTLILPLKTPIPVE